MKNELRQFVIPFLQDELGINVEKSLNKEFSWFVSSPSDELPENYDELSDIEKQNYGTHLQDDKELINFACELGYITDEQVF